MKALLLPIAIATSIVLAPVASAEPIIGSNSYGSLYIASYDDFDVDSAWGGTVKIEYFVNDMFYVTLSSGLARISDSEQYMGSTATLSATTLVSMVGAGVEVPVANNVGFYGEAAVGLVSNSAKVSYNGSSMSDSESGTALGWATGMRFKQNEIFGQIGLASSKADYGDYETEWTNSFGVKAGYFITETVALGVDFGFSRDVNTFGVGITSKF